MKSPEPLLSPAKKTQLNKSLHLAVIIATYNEKDNIEPLIRHIFSMNFMEGDQVSVIVIDDSSVDGTVDILKRLVQEFKDRLHVTIRTERNRGTAAMDGFKKALAGQTTIEEVFRVIHE